MFKDKILLITGGTGSFGQAVLERFLNTNIKEIRIFSRDEKKQDDIRLVYKSNKLKFYIGDVRDYNSVSNALLNVDYVFHAAALKQVPSCEFYPMEAYKTNVLGTDNVINAAINNKVKKLILLSTDKAVYPVNAMGISKAMAEKLLIAKSRLISNNETILCATRYGNVMASRGSVIPLFINQIKNKMPLTITDPNMTRFLMSLDESVELVIHAFNNGEQGDIFVQKSPSSTVLNLAKGVSRSYGVKLNIQVIGTRHGEKLFETLISREEMYRAIEFGKYFKIPADNRDLNYSKYFIDGDIAITNFDDYSSHNSKKLTVSQISTLINKLKSSASI